MSGGGGISDVVATQVLLSLWRAEGGRGEMEMAELMRASGAEHDSVAQALDILAQRKCLIERSAAGVRLVSAGLACWADVLEAQAQREVLRIGRHVMAYARTSSTNDVAWQCAGAAGGQMAAENDGLIIVADEQTAGRGRLGHAWSSKAEQSILLSVLLREPVNQGSEDGGASVDRLTLLSGLAVARGIEAAMARMAGSRLPRIEIKWPNDLLVNGRKLAGILVERRRSQIVIGIGINMAQGAGDFPKELAGRAISVYEASGILMDRLRVAAALVQELDRYCHAPMNDDSWLGEWKSRCGMLGTRIRVRTGGRVLLGQILDVAPVQGLLLRDDSGATHFLSAQTTTLDAGQV